MTFTTATATTADDAEALELAAEMEAWNQYEAAQAAALRAEEMLEAQAYAAEMRALLAPSFDVSEFAPGDWGFEILNRAGAALETVTGFTSRGTADAAAAARSLALAGC